MVLGFSFDIVDKSPTLQSVPASLASPATGDRHVEIPPAPNMTTWAYKQGQFRKQWKKRYGGL